MKPPYILGIDPGLTGALSFFEHEKDRLKDILDMPVIKSPKGKTVDLALLANSISIRSNLVVHAVIEDVYSMPGQGVSSMFKFGENKGMLLGILAACKIPIFKVRPAVWKGSIGLGYSKDEAIQKADQLFPDCKDLWKAKCNDGRAEASLLAYFGKRFL